MSLESTMGIWVDNFYGIFNLMILRGVDQTFLYIYVIYRACRKFFIDKGNDLKKRY